MLERVVVAMSLHLHFTHSTVLPFVCVSKPLTRILYSTSCTCAGTTGCLAAAVLAAALLLLSGALRRIQFSEVVRGFRGVPRSWYLRSRRRPYLSHVLRADFIQGGRLGLHQAPRLDRQLICRLVVVSVFRHHLNFPHKVSGFAEGLCCPRRPRRVYVSLTCTPAHGAFCGADRWLVAASLLCLLSRNRRVPSSRRYSCVMRVAGVFSVAGARPHAPVRVLVFVATIVRALVPLALSPCRSVWRHSQRHRAYHLLVCLTLPALAIAVRIPLRCTRRLPVVEHVLYGRHSFCRPSFRRKLGLRCAASPLDAAFAIVRVVPQQLAQHLRSSPVFTYVEPVTVCTSSLVLAASRASAANFVSASRVLGMRALSHCCHSLPAASRVCGHSVTSISAITAVCGTRGCSLSSPASTIGLVSSAVFCCVGVSRARALAAASSTLTHVPSHASKATATMRPVYRGRSALPISHHLRGCSVRIREQPQSPCRSVLCERALHRLRCARAALVCRWASLVVPRSPSCRSAPPRGTLSSVQLGADRIRCASSLLCEPSALRSACAGTSRGMLPNTRKACLIFSVICSWDQPRSILQSHSWP